MNRIVRATRNLSKDLNSFKFSQPVAYVYNPLDYARRAHELYLERFAAKGAREIIFLGMNPGPWGMAQTGVPFGEVSLVRDWMGIDAKVDKPHRENPKRPIEGFDCERSEVSGRRLWGYFSKLYPKAEEFFAKHFVVNFCPLVFMEEGGRNLTPDKIPAEETKEVFELCENLLRVYNEVLQPRVWMGVGKFAESRLKKLFPDQRVETILHPSPASPAANRGWSEQAEKRLSKLGLEL